MRSGWPSTKKATSRSGSFRACSGYRVENPTSCVPANGAGTLMTSSSMFVSALAPLSRPSARAQWFCDSLGCDPGQQLLDLPAVEDVVGLEPGPLGDVYAELHLAELTGPVRVGADRDLEAQLSGPPGEDIVEVQACGAGVDLHRGVTAQTRLEDLLEVDVVRFPRLHLAAGGVAEDVDVRGGDGAADPGCHLVAGLTELRVHRGHHNVEVGEDVVGHVEAAVRQDVDLDTAQQSEAFVALLDGLGGGTYAGNLVPVGGALDPGDDALGLGVVGDVVVLVDPPHRRLRHFLDGVLAVAVVGVRVEVAAD